MPNSLPLLASARSFRIAGALADTNKINNPSAGAPWVFGQFQRGFLCLAVKNVTAGGLLVLGNTATGAPILTANSHLAIALGGTVAAETVVGQILVSGRDDRAIALANGPISTTAGSSVITLALPTGHSVTNGSWMVLGAASAVGGLGASQLAGPGLEAINVAANSVQFDLGPENKAASTASGGGNGRILYHALGPNGLGASYGGNATTGLIVNGTHLEGSVPKLSGEWLVRLQWDNAPAAGQAYFEVALRPPGGDWSLPARRFGNFRQVVASRWQYFSDASNGSARGDFGGAWIGQGFTLTEAEWTRVALGSSPAAVVGTAQPRRGSIYFGGNPAGALSLPTLNGSAWSIVASGASGSQSNRGSDLATTLANLVTALNASADAQISKCTYGVNAAGNCLLITHDEGGDSADWSLGANTTDGTVTAYRQGDRLARFEQILEPAGTVGASWASNSTLADNKGRLFRSAGAGNSIEAGTVYDPAQTASAVLSVGQRGDRHVWQHEAGSFDVPVTVRYIDGGGSTGIEIRAVNRANDQQVGSSRTVSATGGVWTGTLTLPKGLPLLQIEARRSGGTWTTAQSPSFGVGEIVVAPLGASQEAAIYSPQGEPAAASGNWSVWKAGVDQKPEDHWWHFAPVHAGISHRNDVTNREYAAMIELGNALSAELGCYVGLIPGYSKGGQPISGWYGYQWGGDNSAPAETVQFNTAHYRLHRGLEAVGSQIRHIYFGGTSQDSRTGVQYAASFAGTLGTGAPGLLPDLRANSGVSASARIYTRPAIAETNRLDNDSTPATAGKVGAVSVTLGSATVRVVTLRADTGADVDHGLSVGQRVGIKEIYGTRGTSIGTALDQASIGGITDEHLAGRMTVTAVNHASAPYWFEFTAGMSATATASFTPPNANWAMDPLANGVTNAAAASPNVQRTTGSPGSTQAYREAMAALVASQPNDFGFAWSGGLGRNSGSLQGNYDGVHALAYAGRAYAAELGYGLAAAIKGEARSGGPRLGTPTWSPASPSIIDWPVTHAFGSDLAAAPGGNSTAWSGFSVYTDAIGSQTFWSHDVAGQAARVTASRLNATTVRLTLDATATAAVVAAWNGGAGNRPWAEFAFGNPGLATGGAFGDPSAMANIPRDNASLGSRGVSASLASTFGPVLAIEPSVNVSVSPAAGALVFSGQTPAVSVSVSLAPAAGALVFSGATPGVTVTSDGSVLVAPGRGALVFTGQTPVLTVTSGSADVAVSPAAGALVFTGRTPVVSWSNGAVPQPGHGSPPPMVPRGWHERVIGDTWDFALALADGEGVPIDLSGCQALTWRLGSRSGAAALISVDLASGVYLTNAVSGQVRVLVPPGAQAALAPDVYRHQARVTEADGTVITIELGTVTAISGVEAA